MSELYKVTLTEDEMLLILQYLESAIGWTSGDKQARVRALWERLTDIHEERI